MIKFTVFVKKEKGEVYSWGLSNRGQTGRMSCENASIPKLLFKSDSRVLEIACGGNHSIMRTEDSILVIGCGRFRPKFFLKR